MTFIDFINNSSGELVSAVLGLLTTLIATVAAYFANRIKSALEKSNRKKEIESIINACVGLAERQIPTLTGKEKYEFAAAKASEWLASKGITISETELEIEIEKACNIFVNAVKTEDAPVMPAQDMVSVDGIKDLIEEGEVDNVYDEDN